MVLTSHDVLIEYLDEEEFGEAAESRTYDEDSANSAVELGLLVSKLKFKKSNILTSTCFNSCNSYSEQSVGWSKTQRKVFS